MKLKDFLDVYDDACLEVTIWKGKDEVVLYDDEGKSADYWWGHESEGNLSEWYDAPVCSIAAYEIDNAERTTKFLVTIEEH